MKKHPFLFGTFILTASGLLTRFIGFCYRIFLSKTFTDTQIGIYQLVLPVTSVVFALTAVCYQTIISKFTAEYDSKEQPDRAHLIFTLLTCLSVATAILCSFLVIHFRSFIALRILHEPACAPLLYVVALSFPACSLHTCLNGLFYGRHKTFIPALSQLIEQITRITTVFILGKYALATNRRLSLSGAMVGIVAGETLSALFVFLFMPRFLASLRRFGSELRAVAGQLFGRAIHMLTPLIMNRITLSLMNALETILLPIALRKMGLRADASLAAYGVLTGMALPVILFPSAIPSAASVMLIPRVSSEFSEHNSAKVKGFIHRSLYLVALYASICAFMCIVFGPTIGRLLFHNLTAGNYIRSLGIMCPGMYVGMILLSILHGMGETLQPFLCNLILMAARILSTLVFVPRFGLSAYFRILIIYSYLSALLYYLALHSHMRYNGRDKKQPYGR